MSVNDYLGLVSHPVMKVDAEELQLTEWPTLGARMMSGHTKYHEQLEQECAEFVGKNPLIL